MPVRESYQLEAGKGNPIYAEALRLLEVADKTLTDEDVYWKINQGLGETRLINEYQRLLHHLEPCHEQLRAEEADLAGISPDIAGVYPYTGATGKCLAYLIHLRNLFHELGNFCDKMDLASLSRKRTDEIRETYLHPPRNSQPYENEAYEDDSEEKQYLFHLYGQLSLIDEGLQRMWTLLVDLLDNWTEEYGPGRLPPMRKSEEA